MIAPTYQRRPISNCSFKLQNCFCRLHCEYQLNEEPQLPFWFTPSQFFGQLTISRDGFHVRHFVLYVPNNR